MHSFVTFVFPYINLVLRSSPTRSVSRSAGTGRRRSWERGRPYVTLKCYSMLLVCIRHVPVCIRV